MTRPPPTHTYTHAHPALFWAAVVWHAGEAPLVLPGETAFLRTLSMLFTPSDKIYRHWAFWGQCLTSSTPTSCLWKMPQMLPLSPGLVSISVEKGKLTQAHPPEQNYQRTSEAVAGYCWWSRILRRLDSVRISPSSDGLVSLTGVFPESPHFCGLFKHHTHTLQEGFTVSEALCRNTCLCSFSSSYSALVRILLLQ